MIIVNFFHWLYSSASGLTPNDCDGLATIGAAVLATAADVSSGETKGAVVAAGVTIAGTADTGFAGLRMK